MIEITITNHLKGLQARISTRRWKAGKPKPFTLSRSIWAELTFADGTTGAWYWRVIACDGYYSTEESAIAAGRKYVEGKK